MPQGWEEAMEGFRDLGLCWWRRNLLRTFRRWREHSCPLSAGRGRPHTLVRQNLGGTYKWRKPQGVKKGGAQLYREQAADLFSDERVARSLEVASEGLRRAAGPQCRDDPSYLSGWWEWTVGSTPFFWS